MVNKKRILLCTDVYGWGGHIRAEYIKKYLSDEFHFDIMDGLEFERFYIDTNKSLFTHKELSLYKRQKKGDKNIFNFNEFKKFCFDNKKIDNYDLIYLLFHTQLLRKDVVDMIKHGDDRFITIVTSYPTIRAAFTESMERKEAIDRFLKLANRCRCIMANNKKSLADLRSIYNGKTFYATRGVDENIFYPTKKFKEKPENDFTVAYVGKPVDEKGLENIIRPACIQANVNLITNTRNYTNALTPNEMRNFYNQADVYLVASTIDGTPNPALEAAACGLTLVSNDIGNMPELIINHKNGFLVEREIQRYIHRLNWLKKNQKISWEIGQKGRQAVLNNWTWEKVVNKNERMIFREILK